MRLKQTGFLIFFLFSGLILTAQPLTQTIRGQITDADTGKPLPGATVGLLGTSLGAVADPSGGYRIDNVPVGRYQLKVAYVGYGSIILPEILLESGKELVLDLSLKEQPSELDAVIVRAPRQDVVSDAPNVKPLTVEETLRFPATFFDPARLASTFAGVVQDNDQANGMAVRGNTPNGVLWRLEGLDIVNPNHTPNAGTFSDRVTANAGGVNILSAQLLSTSYLYTGAFPAEYGNALSGVMDMRLRQGNNQQHEFTGQAGLIGVELASEGPVASDMKASYLVNYRYSFVGLLNLMGVEVGDEDITFQDLSFNLVFPGKNGSVFTLFGMGGISENIFKAERDSTLWEFRKDRYDIIFRSQMGAVGSTYTTPVGSKGIFRVAAAASGLSSTRTGDRLDANYEPIRLEDDKYDQVKISFHSYYQHKLSQSSKLKIGLQLNQQHFDIYADQIQGMLAEGNGGGLLVQPYVNWQSNLGPAVVLNAGLHYSWFGFNGSSALEPRASLAWHFSRKQSFNLSYGLHSQLQLPQLYFARSGGAAGNEDLDLTKAHHLGLGYQVQIRDNTRFNAELFWQSLFDVPVADAQGPGSLSAINLVEGFVPYHLVNQGTGNNYGLELSLQRFMADGFYYLTNATLYNSTYKGRDGIERDTRFNGKYIFNATAGKEWIRRAKADKTRLWGLNLRVAYIGGFRDTPIDVAASRQAGYTVYEDDLAFTIQQKAYFRTDLRAYLKWNNAKASSTLSLDIQNLTGAENEAFRYYDVQQNTVLIQHQLGFIPLLSYRIEF
ncbi:MAG: TonB-dependent receptor [Lewinellaceae bacterium]|nr:TonB-dependent receptor [Lewinella sp.]MCB9282073.1 TonB-dependent receptor [Lewinellaceae bacterium]